MSYNEPEFASSSDLNEIRPVDFEEGTKLQYATWGSTGTQLLFIHDFDVYYKTNATSESEPIKLLESGAESAIYHILPGDWVYPDDEYPSLTWSENGEKLLAFTYDNREVLDTKYGFYGDSEDATNRNPELVSIKYPKVSLDNPQITY